MTPYDGAASFVDANTIKVAGGKSDGETIETDNVIIAVGSEVAGLPGFPKELIDEKNIVSSTGGLEFKSVPKTLTVVGGGVIGLELGSVWARLGAKVHVVEFLDKIMGPADAEVSAQFQKMLEKQGLTFSMGSKVVAVEDTGAGVKLAWEDMKSGEKTEQVAEKVGSYVGDEGDVQHRMRSTAIINTVLSTEQRRQCVVLFLGGTVEEVLVLDLELIYTSTSFLDLHTNILARVGVNLDRSQSEHGERGFGESRYRAGQVRVYPHRRKPALHGCGRGRVCDRRLHSRSDAGAQGRRGRRLCRGTDSG